MQKFSITENKQKKYNIMKYFIYEKHMQKYTISGNIQNMQNMQKISKNMQKYTKLCKICINMQKYAKVFKILRFSKIAKSRY